MKVRVVFCPLLCLLVCLLAGVRAGWAAVPLVDLSRADSGLHGARVPPNLLLNLSLSHAAAGAAHGGEYQPGRDYAGYFDARMCYSYPYRNSNGVLVADWRLSSAYFSVSKPADAGHGCGGDSFSGNFLNWAGASLLDIVRYALTGGDRVIDEVRKTVLQRAYLPDGQYGIDFYAHPGYFPRKVLRAGVREATPFAVAQLAIVSCRDRLLFGDGAQPPGGNCEAPGAAGALGVFLARVQVCDAAEGIARPDLCLAYAKNHKPVGALQREGGRVRVGVFGHASGAARYGGVLQAPLSHLGIERSNAPDFLPQDNPDPAWHRVTGVQLANQGVLAYLNTLGRADEASPGAYAAAAPQAELLYESLRYLQGRQASTMDGPTSWVDPQQASCQRHIVMTLGDAGAAADRYLPGHIPVANAGERARGVDAASSPPLDVMAWTRAVGALESDGVTGNPQPLPALAALDRLEHGAHGGSFYAAGLAYWSHRQALRSGGVPVEHYAGELLAAGAPADAMSPSPLLLAAKYGGFVDENGDGNPYRSIAGDAHAEWSVDGRWPSHYLSAGDPQALIALLRAAVRQAGRTTAEASIAGPSLMALANGSEPAYWFQSQINLADGAMRVWRAAFRVGADGGVVAGKPVWRIDGSAAPPRPVHTLDAQGALMPLAWDRLDTAQRRAFDLQGDGHGEARLAYLLGERQHEVGRPGGFLRRRAAALAAAPHGNLVHVGTPALGLPGADYLLHRQRGQQRRKMLYLATGDGLLHGVDAGSGSELFAYLPQALLAGAALASGSGSEAAAGPLLDGAAASAELLVAGRWKTVLASGMGAGAQGLFALDITDPSRFAQDGAIWEFTDRDDAMIGNLRAPPGFARLNMGGKQGQPVYRDMVVVASGYNNTQYDGEGRAAGSAAAAIFLLALDKPAGAPWLLGSNYHRLKVPVRDDDAASSAQALAPPALVAGNDGALAYLYAGDLQGNLWRIDMATGPPWKDEVGRKLVFVARDAQGRRQAISQQPKVAYAPGGGYLLLFGTGKLVEAADTWPAAMLAQSFYAVHDDLNEQNPTRSRADLAPRSIGVAHDAGSLAIGGAPLHYTGGGARHGWYLDFVGTEKTGERSVHAAVLAAGRVAFNTVLPGRDPCSKPMTRLYVLDVLSGFAADAAGTVQAGQETGRLLSGLARAPPQLLEVASQVSVAGATGRAEGRKQFAVVQPGMPGAAAVKAASGPLPAGRLGWREVANWRDLHEAAKK